MKQINSSLFQRSYHFLTEPHEVTRDGVVIAEYHPRAAAPTTSQERPERQPQPLRETPSMYEVEPMPPPAHRNPPPAATTHAKVTHLPAELDPAGHRYVIAAGPRAGEVIRLRDSLRLQKGKFQMLDIEGERITVRNP